MKYIRMILFFLTLNKYLNNKYNMIDLKNKIIYWPNPKCASTSIRNAMLKKNPKCKEVYKMFSKYMIKKEQLKFNKIYKWNGMLPSIEVILILLQNKYKVNLDEFTIFTTIRNPYDIFVSSYLFAKRKQRYNDTFETWVTI